MKAGFRVLRNSTLKTARTLAIREMVMSLWRDVNSFLAERC